MNSVIADGTKYYGQNFEFTETQWKKYVLDFNASGFLH